MERLTKKQAALYASAFSREQQCMECGSYSIGVEDDGEGDGPQPTCNDCHSRNVKTKNN